jgi:hypothetical protein
MTDKCKEQERARKKLADTLRKLFALMGSDNEHESQGAKQKIHELQQKYKLSWNDVLELVGVGGNNNNGDGLNDLFEQLLKANRKQADKLIDLAKEASLFRTDDGSVWADIDIDGHRETWPVRSSGFKRWLLHQYWREEKSAPGATSVDTATAHLEASAFYDGSPRRAVFLRVADYGGKIYLDLADDGWSVIEIDASGWRVVRDPPARFQRTPAMAPLPMPQRGGTLVLLRKLMHVKDEDDFIVLVAWLLAALRGKHPYPILAIAGPAGAAKSTLLRFARDLVDPNKLEPGALPKETRDLAVGATKRFINGFDNLSGIPAEIADALARLSTGGGFAIRSLYTDDEEKVFSDTRPVMLAGIEDVAGRHDLSERVCHLTQNKIDGATRKFKEDLDADYEQARPLILGRLLDMVAHGLRHLPTTKVDRLPRMADFARWIAACETAEWEAGTFARAYAANRASLVDVSMEADAVATAIVELVEVAGEWSGNAKALLTKLNRIADEATQKQRSWPRSPERMSGRLRRASSLLHERGIEVVPPGKTDKTRIWSLRRMAPQSGGTGKTAQTAQTAETDTDQSVGGGARSGGCEAPPVPEPTNTPGGLEPPNLTAQSSALTIPLKNNGFGGLGGLGGLSGAPGNKGRAPTNHACSYCGGAGVFPDDPTAPYDHPTEAGVLVWLHSRCEAPFADRPLCPSGLAGLGK